MFRNPSLTRRLSPLLWALLVGLAFSADRAAAENPADSDPAPTSNGDEPSALGHDPERLSAGLGSGGGASSERDDHALLTAGTAQLIRAADFSPADVLDHYGVGPEESCRTYRKWSYLVVLKRRWLEAIRTLSHTHPDFLYGWLIGVRKPPDRVRKVVLQQRDCLLDDLYRRSARSESRLRIEVELDDHLITSPSRLRRLANSYLQGGETRSRLRRKHTESYYRSAFTQAEIWHRKAAFRGTHFNRITERAARKCGLPVGASWKPEVERHKRCWRRTLTDRDREREILGASAAPGLSRHHWGTEIDLFELSPHQFRVDRRRWDEYQWLSQHALAYGFFQSYDDSSDTYVEERWHWSYYPVAQALTEFASDNRSEVLDRLDRLWTRLERKFETSDGDRPVSFDYIRDHWRRYMFDVSVPPVGGRPRSRTNDDDVD